MEEKKRKQSKEQADRSSHTDSPGKGQKKPMMSKMFSELKEVNEVNSSGITSPDENKKIDLKSRNSDSKSLSPAVASNPSSGGSQKKSGIRRRTQVRKMEETMKRMDDTLDSL